MAISLSTKARNLKYARHRGALYILPVTLQNFACWDRFPVFFPRVSEKRHCLSILKAHHFPFAWLWYCVHLRRATTHASSCFPFISFSSFQTKLPYRNLTRLFTSCKSKVRVISIDQTHKWNKWHTLLSSFWAHEEGVVASGSHPQEFRHVWTELTEHGAVLQAHWVSCQPRLTLSHFSLCPFTLSKLFTL